MNAPPAFGPYRVFHQTGNGVLGPVFRAFDLGRDRLVAVKAFTLDVSPERIVSLADALRDLAARPVPAGSSIVPVLDAGVEGTMPFVVMDCQTGESLDVVIRRLAPMPLEFAVPILSAAADAIDHAASAGLRHGALHPRDIFVLPEGGIRITGFGIVDACARAGISTPVRRLYAAPDRRLHPESAWDSRADIYALGVIAHEMLTGVRPPAPGEQDGAFAPSVSPGQRVQLRRVLAVALAERPDDRYGLAMAFAEHLLAILHRDRGAASARREAAAPMTIESDTGFLVAGIVADAGPLPEWPPSAESAADDAARADTRVAEAAADADAADDDETMVIAPAVTAPPVPDTDREQQGEPADDAPREPAAEAAAIVAAARPTIEPPARGAQAPHPRDVAHFDLIRPPAVRHATPIGRDRPRRGTSLASMAAVAVLALACGSGLAYLVANTQGEWVASLRRAVDRTPVTSTGVSHAGADIALGPETERAGAPPEAAPGRAADARAADAQVNVAPGRLYIRSDPPGALVTVDGRLSGETPATVRGLAPGTYLVRVAHPGHVPHEARVTLGSERPVRTLSFDLEPGLDPAGPSLGAVDVDSRPRRATVSVDGRRLGRAPLRVPALRPGPHTVVIEMGGYATVTRVVDVTPGAPVAVRVTLQSLVR
jgi:hypothetical protein